MKQKDIALIIIIVAFSAIISYVVSNQFFGPAKHQEKGTHVQKITAEFPEPDDHYFNKDAFDPTRSITIGQDTNATPFKGNSDQSQQ